MAVAGTALFAGIVAWTTQAIEAWQKQQKAIALVERGMERVWDTWKSTTDDMIAEATRLQKTSIFWDEDILQKVTNNLLTFWNVGEDVFFKAQQSAIDLATTLEWDLQSATIMLWKALENPTEWIWALTRVGIAFTDQQKSQIEALQSSGDLLWAQSVILWEVERMYGWAGQAAATALWPMHQLQKELWDVVEELWIAFAPAIQQVADAIRPLISSLTEWIMKNPELTKNIILVVAAISWLIAIIGTIWLIIPSLVAWFWAISTALWVVKLAFIAVWWPITILIALMAVLVIMVITNREQIKQWFLDGVEAIKILIWALWTYLSTTWMSIMLAIQTFRQNFMNAWTWLWDWVVWYVTNKVNGMISWLQAWLSTVTWIVNSIKSAFESAKSMVWSWVSAVTNAITWKRAFWGTVQSWKSYLVWERWPEIITPASTSKVSNSVWWGMNISINMGGVTVSNSADENRLVDKITEALTRQS